MSPVTYYALFVSEDGSTMGFRPMGTFPEGQRPALTGRDVLGVTEAMLKETSDLLDRHTDPNDYFLLEIEGVEGNEDHTSGRLALSHIGLFIGPKGATKACEGRVLKFKQHWMLTVYRRADVLKIFTKLENPSRCLH